MAERNAAPQQPNTPADNTSQITPPAPQPPEQTHTNPYKSLSAPDDDRPPAYATLEPPPPPAMLPMQRDAYGQPIPMYGLGTPCSDAALLARRRTFRRQKTVIISLTVVFILTITALAIGLRIERNEESQH